MLVFGMVLKLAYQILADRQIHQQKDKSFQYADYLCFYLSSRLIPLAVKLSNWQLIFLLGV